MKFKFFLLALSISIFPSWAQTQGKNFEKGSFALGSSNLHALMSAVCSTHSFQRYVKESAEGGLGLTSLHSWNIERNGNELRVEGFCSAAVAPGLQGRMDLEEGSPIELIVNVKEFENNWNPIILGTVGTQRLKLTFKDSIYYSPRPAEMVTQRQLGEIDLGADIYSMVRSIQMGYHLSLWGRPFWTQGSSANFDALRLGLTAARSFGDRMLRLEVHPGNDKSTLMVKTGPILEMEENGAFRGNSEESNNVFMSSSGRMSGCSNLRFNSLGKALELMTKRDCTRLRTMLRL